MFFQLGNIVFTGLFSPSTFNVDGDEATYAEFELISGKSRLQKTGDTLQELSFEIKLHAEYCNPTEQINLIKEAKGAGTVLPMLMGDGRYINDYVIFSSTYTVDEAFADGTIKQATLSLTIKEYIASNKLEQQQQQARKDGFAVGVKTPAITRPPQPLGVPKIIAMEITAATQQTTKVDGLVSDYEQNTSQQNITAKWIMDACNKAQAHITEMNSNLDKANEVENKFQSIRSSGQNVFSQAEAIKNQYPFTSISDLRAANTILQAGTSSFQLASSGLLHAVAIRQPIN
jgi:phage protein U